MVLMDRCGLGLGNLGNARIWGKATFLLTMVLDHNYNTVSHKKCSFLAPKVRILVQKSVFLLWDPDFCQRGVPGPHCCCCFGTYGSNFRLFVSEYHPFHEGTRPTWQKVYLHPSVGAPSDSYSPSALSTRAG